MAQNSITVNVSALSSALAAAIQQASDGQTPGDTNQQSASNQEAGPSTSRRSASDILPSFLKRRRQESRDVGARPKRPKAVQFWDRDIVCLPQQCEGSAITPLNYLRGKYRAQLAQCGLIGKMRLISTMTVEEVEREVRSVFREPMGNRSDFPFLFLQPTGSGSRKLTAPCTSSSFSWTANQVAKLGGYKQAVYIIAMDRLVLPEQSEGDSSSDENGEMKSQKQEHQQSTEAPVVAGESSHVFNAQVGNGRRDVDNRHRSYANLCLDLTLSSSEESAAESDVEDVPRAAISFRSAERSTDYEKVDIVVAKHVIQQHQAKVITGIDEEDRQRIHVRRSNIIRDTIRAFSKPQFNVSKMLKVVFIGEPSVDEGGPRREFFNLVMTEAFTASGLFVGWPHNVIPIHNVEVVASNKFYIIGKIIATCLVQGGKPPVCFSTAIADYLVYDEIKCNPCLSDIPDNTIQEKLKKVQEAVTTNELKELDDELAFRFDCGYTKPTANIELSDREALVKAVWLHYVFFAPHAELEQLRKGLRDTLQVELLMCLHPREMHSFLVDSKDFDVTPYFLDSFAVRYSDQGSNNRTSEEAVILHWTDYIMECAAHGGRDVTLPDILNFLCGSSKLPAAGLGVTPSICFTGVNCLPRSSTCDVSITFPRSFGLLTYLEFQEKLDTCILDSYGFGNP